MFKSFSHNCNHLKEVSGEGNKLDWPLTPCIYDPSKSREAAMLLGEITMVAQRGRP